MSKFKYIKSLCLVIFSALILTGSNFYANKVIANPATQTATITQTVKDYTSPHLIVNSPKSYLNKTIAL